MQTIRADLGRLLGPGAAYCHWKGSPSKGTASNPRNVGVATLRTSNMEPDKGPFIDYCPLQKALRRLLSSLKGPLQTTVLSKGRNLGFHVRFPELLLGTWPPIRRFTRRRILRTRVLPPPAPAKAQTSSARKAKQPKTRSRYMSPRPSR